ncbi:MAG: DUF2911 domain-containing protein [Cyclobacteriaceae bacterium]
MLRKILIGVGVLVMVLGGILMYLNNQNRTKSPPGEVSATIQGVDVSVAYSRPSVRGRLVFGTEAEGALQPYGKYWRLGANEGTEITFSGNVRFMGEKLDAGAYRVYTYPGKDVFEVRVGTQTGSWGAWEPDPEEDIFTTSIPVQSNSLVEQFTIDLVPNNGILEMVVTWEKIKLVFPIEPA